MAKTIPLYCLYVRWSSRRRAAIETLARFASCRSNTFRRLCRCRTARKTRGLNRASLTGGKPIPAIYGKQEGDQHRAISRIRRGELRHGCDAAACYGNISGCRRWPARSFCIATRSNPKSAFISRTRGFLQTNKSRSGQRCDTAQHELVIDYSVVQASSLAPVWWIMIGLAVAGVCGSLEELAIRLHFSSEEVGAG